MQLTQVTSTRPVRGAGVPMQMVRVETFGPNESIERCKKRPGKANIVRIALVFLVRRDERKRPSASFCGSIDSIGDAAEDTCARAVDITTWRHLIAQCVGHVCLGFVPKTFEILI